MSHSDLCHDSYGVFSLPSQQQLQAAFLMGAELTRAVALMMLCCKAPREVQRQGSCQQSFLEWFQKWNLTCMSPKSVLNIVVQKNIFLRGTSFKQQLYAATPARVATTTTSLTHPKNSGSNSSLFILKTPPQKESLSSQHPNTKDGRLR
jgi:hypothetical protein